MIFIYSQLLTILHVRLFGIQIVPAGDRNRSARFITFCHPNNKAYFEP